MASMSALGVDEKRPPHMELAAGLLVSFGTLFHPMDSLHFAFATLDRRRPSPQARMRPPTD
jgi:hypothetical protein